jgi:hypothetical protein
VGLNDEQEKVQQAKEWLETRIPGSQEWDAAWYHLTWVAGNEDCPFELRAFARQVMEATENPTK